MAYFKNKTFKGIAPAISPRLLNEEYGQEAENIDFESGTLVPVKTDSADSTFSTSSRQSVFIYRHRTATGSSATTPQQLEWDEDYVKAVHSPLATDDDEYQRVYWTGSGTSGAGTNYPKMASQSVAIGATAFYPSASYRLGIPAPSAAPTTSKSGTPTATQEPDSVSYVYTYVSAYGEEGPPSAASTPIDKTDDETVALTLAAFPTGSYNLTKMRIYRSNTGSTSTNFQFCGEITSGTSFSDTVTSTGLGEVLPSTTWVGPPNDDTSLYPYGPLENLINVGNGVLAGHSGNRLCFSEPYLPHAWPVQYRLTIDGTIVGLSATANGVVVLTESVPFFVSGVDPSAMTAMQVDVMQSCINKHSIVDMGEYVLYASPDGLVAITGTSGQVVTRGLIKAKQWNSDFKPSAIKAFLHEGKYVAFWKDGSNYGGWVYDPQAQDTIISTLSVSAEVRGGTTDIGSGNVYLIVGSNAMKYAGGATNQTAKWKSKKYVTETPLSMGWVSVNAAIWPTALADAITVKVYGDGNQIANYQIYSGAAVSVTKAVTVATGTNSYGTGNKYFIDGVVSPTVSLKEGSTYIFDQSDASNTNHPLLFSTTANGSHNSGASYMQGVTIVGTPGQSGSYTQIVVPTGAPPLHYYCGNHSGMGGTANTLTTSPYVMRNGSTETNLYEPIMRLPATVAQEWEVEVETKYEVTETCIAQSIDEIKAT